MLTSEASISVLEALGKKWAALGSSGVMTGVTGVKLGMVNNRHIRCRGRDMSSVTWSQVDNSGIRSVYSGGLLCNITMSDQRCHIRSELLCQLRSGCMRDLHSEYLSCGKLCCNFYIAPLHPSRFSMAFILSTCLVTNLFTAALNLVISNDFFCDLSVNLRSRWYSTNQTLDLHWLVTILPPWNCTRLAVGWRWMVTPPAEVLSELLEHLHCLEHHQSVTS
jgi:hypothetical protein